MMLRLYDAGVAAVVWGGLAPLEGWRCLRGRAGSGDLRERLGGPVRLRADGLPLIVVHAVSAGEMQAASALVRELGKRLPDHGVVLTCMTADGRRAAEALRRDAPNVQACAFLPWDRAAATRAWLQQLRPRAVVVVETEIWPNLYRQCRALGIPLLIASGRIYPRDVSRYRLLRPVLRPVLESVAWLGVQSAEEAAAFVRIGAPEGRIEVAGNLKYDAPPARRALPGAWRQDLTNGRPLLVAGSTHAPEERWLLAILPALQEAVPGTRLVIAPRHVRRAPSLQRMAARAGLRAGAFSAGAQPSRPWDVLVVDAMGWLATLYELSDVVIAGGTFARCGGHNLVEAAAHAKPIVAGPHAAHVRQDLEALASSGAAIWLRDGKGLRARLETTLCALLADADECRRRGARAAEVVARGRGAAARCAEQVVRQVGARRPASGIERDARL